MLRAPVRQTTGFRFWSPDRQQVFQVRLDGFLFSRLTPYTEWEQWQPEARRSGDRYCSVVRPRSVVRIAVRYVNRVSIGADRVEPEDYF